MKHPSYQHLLFGVVLLYLLIIVVPAQHVGGPLRVALIGVLLLMALRTGRRAGRLGKPTLAIVVAAVVATILAAITGSETVLACFSQGSTVLLVVITIAILAQTLLAAGVIDGPAVRGVLSIYLLLGLLFSALHGFSAALITDYLNGTSKPPTQSDTLYFSLITLTTVGYGDITPAANLARAIAAIEAITGQLYLVSIVAAVVGRFEPIGRGRASRGDARNESTTDDAPDNDRTQRPSQTD